MDRKGDGDGETATGSREHIEGGSMGFRYVVDDGEGEPETVRRAGPVRGAALEGWRRQLTWSGAGVWWSRRVPW
jgi:hypothetical protein